MYDWWIRRGTTPTLTFEFDTSLDEFQIMHIAFEQNGSVVFIKTKENCYIDGNIVSVTLSQAETMLLKSGVKVNVQISVKYQDGTVDRTNPVVFGVTSALEGII